MGETRSSASRVQRRRDKMRAEGLRPVQFWAPDTRVESFNRTCAQQVEAIRRADTLEGREFDALWQAAADTAGWTS